MENIPVSSSSTKLSRVREREMQTYREMGRTKVAAMMRAQVKKANVEIERAVQRRWRPSLSSIAEEEEFRESRARPTPAVVKLKTPKGGAYFAITVAKAHLWSSG